MGIVICQNIKSKIKVVIVGSLLNKIQCWYIYLRL